MDIRQDPITQSSRIYMVNDGNFGVYNFNGNDGVIRLFELNKFSDENFFRPVQLIQYLNNVKK